LAKGGLSISRRDQDPEEGELGAGEEGRLVPLRPVSELGLVDITDVPERGTQAATRSHSKRARSHPSQSRAASTPKRVSTARNPRKAASSTRARPTKAADAQPRQNSKPRRPSAGTTNAERPRSRSKAARDTGSGGTTRSATTRTPKRPNGSASRTRGATTARRHTTKPSSAAKVGIYALAGASLVAAGLLLARAALHR